MTGRLEGETAGLRLLQSLEAAKDGSSLASFNTITGRDTPRPSARGVAIDDALRCNDSAEWVAARAATTSCPSKLSVQAGNDRLVTLA